MITTNRFATVLIAAAFALLLLSVSCKEDVIIYDDDDDTNAVVDDDDLTPTPGDDDDAPSASLVGVVLNAYGQPLGDVAVSILGTTSSAETDGAGRFRLDDLVPSDRAIITFRKETYARTSLPIELRENIENTIVQRMAVVDHIFSFDSGDGYTFGDEEPLKLEFSSDNVVDAQGELYNGSVIVEVTIFDLVSDADDGNEILATPGDFTAVNSVGEEKTLESYGMVQINMATPSGEDLQLGSQASMIRLPVQSLGTPPVVGDEISAWSYNETLGKWEEEAVGTVAEFEGSLVWEFEAPHFSTWNCDRPISTHGCLTGTVTDSAGSPRGGATVRAVGITYISTTTARTDQDGSFCLEVKNGETVWAEISYSIAGQTATQRTDPVSISPGQASCSLGEGTCNDLGTIPVDIQTCMSGMVVDAQGAPVSGQQIVSPSGGVATTDANGSFCMITPVFQTSEVFVLTEIDEVGYKPVRVYTQPGLPDCQAGCPNLAVIRPYDTTSCVHGSVVVNGQLAENLLVEVFDLEFPSVRIHSTLSNSDGSFCTSVPGGTNASVQIGAGDNLCGAETVNTDNIGGEGCADVGQTAECYSLNDFVCSL
tara:strand:+ start:272 stop:2059 length:1788 start_codon:yes stop_codon:yes gene_type:complete